MKAGKILALSACVVALASCGGSSDPTTGEATVVAPTASGVLTDGPVGGVSYLTSGGFSDVTAADGTYKYNPGETVTFSIGKIALGTVTATGTVTPLQLAGTGATSSNKTTNLLVLLQSLDANNNPADGITINAATKAAAENATSLDLTQAPADFASAANSALVAVMSGGGLERTAPVSTHDALAHFQTEFFKQLKGGWAATVGESTFIIRFDEKGTYLHGEAGPSHEGGFTGIEGGHINWDPKTGMATYVASDVPNGNGSWGLSEAAGTESMHVDGDQLVVTDKDGTVTKISRVVNDPNTIVGMWALNSPTAIKTQTFVFFPDGRYMMADPLGDTQAIKENRTPCNTTGGLEFGKYTYNATTGVFAVTEAPAYDTNSCAGAWDKPANSGVSFTVTFDDSTKSTFTLDGEVFHRISK